VANNSEQLNIEDIEHSGQEVSHQATLFAEPIAHIGGFTITNSLATSWIAVLILVILFYFLSKKISQIPRGVQNIFEIILEHALKIADSMTGSREKSEKFLPLSLALFLYILVNNLLGLFPGVGTIGFDEVSSDHAVFVPILRGGTADINTTLALALTAVIASHIFGILAIGSWNYFNKYLNLKAFGEIPGKIGKDFAIVLVNPIKAFVGVVELVGEIAKVASLSFRLFGNIFAGEVLLMSMMAIFAYFLPLPFIFLEIIICLIQALIFAILTLVYASVATQVHEEH
jgi:F-type H+-transporting ATPase subunit a